MIRNWLMQKHNKASRPKQNSVIDFPLPLLPAAVTHVKSVLRQQDSMKGPSSAGRESASKGIHVLPFLLAWTYICLQHALDAVSFPYNSLARLHLQRCSGLNKHTPTLPKPPSQCDLARHDPASFPLPCHFLTELPLLSQHVNNMRKTALFVFN